MLGGTDAAAIADGLRKGGSVLRPEEVHAILSSDRSADSYELYYHYAAAIYNWYCAADSIAAAEIMAPSLYVRALHCVLSPSAVRSLRSLLCCLCCSVCLMSAER